MAPMATTILFTGFPGFLGRELLPRVLARDPATRPASARIRAAPSS